MLTFLTEALIAVGATKRFFLVVEALMSDQIRMPYITFTYGMSKDREEKSDIDSHKLIREGTEYTYRKYCSDGVRSHDVCVGVERGHNVEGTICCRRHI